MKKLLLSIALSLSVFTAFAQTITATRDWTLIYGNSPLITRPAANPTSLNGNQSLAYNPTTNRIYLVDRESKINILNSDGTVYATKPTLTIGTVLGNPWSDGYRFNKIRVAADGAIYAICLKLSSGDLFVYRWASESDAAPTRTAIEVPGRSGDSFAVYGSGDNTRLYFGGSANNKITVASVVGQVVSKAFDIDMGTTGSTPNGYARSSISPISTTEFIVKSAGDAALRKLTIAAEGDIVNSPIVAATFSTITTGTTAGQIHQNYTGLEYFEREGKKYLAAYGAVVGSNPAGNKGLDFEIFNVTAGFTGAQIVRMGGGRMLDLPALPDASTNPNAFADIAIRNNIDGKLSFFQVLHGTGVAAYTTVEVVLPVSLTSFKASLVKGQSTLTWETASESNNQGFEVLRSTDGKDFSKIDFVNAKAQNGNSSTALSYTYVDRTAKSGLNYYRLKQIDLDGKSELFDRNVSVDMGLKGGTIVAFPNPATNYVRVTTSGADYKGFKYELFDTNGKKVLSEKAKAPQQEISLSKLPTSVYFLKVSKNDVEQQTIKLIKQ